MANPFASARQLKPDGTIVPLSAPFDYEFTMTCQVWAPPFNSEDGDIRSLIMELVAQPDAASPADTFRFAGADQVSVTDAEFDLCLPLADTTS